MQKIYANKKEIERAEICHRHSVDSWIKQGKIEQVVIVGGEKDGVIMYTLPIDYTKSDKKE